MRILERAPDIEQALRRGNRQQSAGRAGNSANRDPAGAGRRRRIEHALTARRPRTRYLVGVDTKLQARAKIVIPARVWDRIVARIIGL